MRETTARSNYWGLLTQLPPRRRRGRIADAELHAEPQPHRLRPTIATRSTSRRIRSTSRSNTPTRAPIAGTSSPPTTSTSCRSSRTRRTRVAEGDARRAGRSPASRPSTRASRCSRISESTNGFLRGGRPNIVGDPGAGEQTANLFWFNPNAYAPAADGTYGNSVRAEWRQPGRNQTDLSLSKNWTFNGTQRLQFRADFINAFNHTQWLADPNVNGLDNTCTISLTTCNAVERHVRPDPEHPRAARDSARIEVLLVEDIAMKQLIAVSRDRRGVGRCRSWRSTRRNTAPIPTRRWPAPARCRPAGRGGSTRATSRSPA